MGIMVRTVNGSLLILSQYFHPEPNGSAPPVSDFALWLAENGYAPQVVTARPSYPQRRVFEGYRRGERDSENWNGVGVRRLSSPIIAAPGLMGRLVNEGGFAARLVWSRLTGGQSPERHVLAVCPSVLVALAAGAYRAPEGRLVILVHDIQSGLSRLAGGGAVAGVLRALERAALNRADCVITLSECMRDVLVAGGVTAPIDILPPQLDVSEFRVRPEPEGQIQLLYSGAFGHKQGLPQLISAAKVLEDRGVCFDMVLRGAGGIEPELRARIGDLALRNVRIEPLTPRSRLCEAMGNGAIHLAPQDPAGGDFAVPSKVFSIMAAGRPFVATAMQGSPLERLTAQSGAGVCVPPEAPAALADALQALISDADARRRMGLAGRAWAERNVDRSVVCPSLAAILQGDAPAASPLRGRPAVR